MNDSNSKAEQLQNLIARLMKVVLDLKTVEEFLDAAKTGEVPPGTYEKLKLDSIVESQELHLEVLPYLKDMQSDAAFKETLELFGIDEFSLQTLTKN